MTNYTIEQLEEMVKSDDVFVRMEVARQGYGLDLLINDQDTDVRAEVAKHGYGLDILVNDESWVVRAEVVKKGYGLDILINDESWVVRAEVAEQGYGLDKLINDIDEDVRLQVAKHGYRLDILINDKSWMVRLEVVKHSYGLNVLIKDKDTDVRAEVAKQGYGLDILIKDESCIVRKEVAKQGYGLDILVDDIDEDVRDIANKLIKFKNHKVIARSFGTYNGNLYLHYNNEFDYLIMSGCYDTTDISNWKIKCENRIDIETAEKYTDLILKELDYKDDLKIDKDYYERLTSDNNNSVNGRLNYFIDFELDNISQANKLLTIYHNSLENSTKLAYFMTDEFELRYGMKLPKEVCDMFNEFLEFNKFKYKEDLK